MPISDAAVDAADGEVGLANKVRVFLERAKQLSADGLTLSEFGELGFALLSVLVSSAEGVPAPGPQRKQWVMHAVGVFFDEVADLVVPVYVKPLWVIFRPAFRTLYMRIADGAIEAILSYVRGATL